MKKLQEILYMTASKVFGQTSCLILRFEDNHGRILSQREENKNKI